MRIDRLFSHSAPAFTLTQPSPRRQRRQFAIRNWRPPVAGEGLKPHVPSPRWGRRGEGEWRTLLAIALVLIAPTANAAPSGAEMMQGGNLFAITCSSSFCHGDGGVGARGPSLRNRNFTPDFVRNTVSNGRSGTPMPAFKDSLSQAELNMLVDYVMSLSPNNHSASTAESVPAPAMPASAPLSEKALAGSAIFFDATRPGACALCHSYKEQGGPIGPDLTGIAKRTPRDIYQGMIKPPVPNADYTVVSVATEDGKTATGLLKQKTDTAVQLYDLSSVPPVLRSFYGAKIGVAAATPPYVHDLSGLSKDDLAALITFLKSSDPTSKDVTPQDLAQP
jgi:putative heme-binding domain-containing protein